MLLSYLLLPIVAALIGWFTNWLAVKMLFHPRYPKKILFMTFQGVFPKRQVAFAQSLGKLVSSELISMNEVTEHVKKAATSDESMNFIMEKLSTILSEKLPQAVPMLAMIINPDMVRSILAPLSAELKNLIEGLSERISSEVESNLDVHELVSEKVMNFSVEKLETIVNGIMKRELREIEILGGVLGFLIGCCQAALNFYLNSL